MQIFSRLIVCFLGVALLLAGGTVDVHAQRASLEFGGDIGPDKVYAVGDTVQVTFLTTLDGVAVPGVRLTITHNGLTGVVNGGTTNLLGSLTVRGKIAALSGVYIQAEWPAQQLLVRGGFTVVDTPGSEEVVPALIVVDPPDPKSPLGVGDTFTQTIEIQDATDLTSWQMDIAFNPDVLEVVDISEGDFLKGEEAYDESDWVELLKLGGKETLFFVDEQNPGKIAIRQVRVRIPGAPMSGISGAGVLVKLNFRFVSFSEALLGLHNVRLSDSSGERLSYTVTLTPVVATHTSAAVEDINQDGKVDILDLVVVASSIGAAQPNLRADVNDDGIVDILDLVVIADSPHWGKSVAFIQVREPNAAAPAEEVEEESGGVDIGI